MNKKIAEIKTKQERLAELLDMYSKALESEGKQYHLKEDEENNRIENWGDTVKCECGKGRINRLIYNIPDYKYLLVNTNTKQVVCYGSKQRLKSFMRIRKIEMVDVIIDVKNFQW